MPVAYTAPLQPRQGADFSGSIAALGQQRAQKAAQEQAIMKQMEARQKATNKMLSEVDGYDVSKLIPPFRQHFKDMLAGKMEEIQNFAIDDPVKARMAIQDIATWFNNHASHNSEDVQKTRSTYIEVSTDASVASKYNDNLPVYQQHDATPQGSIMAQQQFEGSNIVTYLGDDDTVFFKNVDPETGEEMGEWKPVQEWELFANPSTFAIPTKDRYGSSAQEVGGGRIQDSVRSAHGDYWNRDKAIEASRAVISSGSVDKEANGLRAWAVQNLMAKSYRNDDALLTAYITGDINNPLYSQNKDYLETINNKLVDSMVEASKYPPPVDDDKDLSSGERDQKNYLDTVRRETVKAVEGMAVNVSDPSASEGIASETFGGIVQGVTGEAQSYTLPKGLKLTNVDNPMFGRADDMDTVVGGGVNQVIELEDVRKVMFIPASEEYPQGIMVIRDVSVEGMPQNHMIFDYGDQRDRTVVEQVIQEMAGKSGATDLTFPMLSNGWDRVQDITPETTTQSSGGFDPNAYNK